TRRRGGALVFVRLLIRLFSLTLMPVDANDRPQRVRAMREKLHAAGPMRSRPFDGDFERVALPQADCDVLRDTLVAQGARVVIEVGLAYGSSALAIGEALCSTGRSDFTHVIIDPFQATAYDNVGLAVLNAAELSSHITYIDQPS